MPVILLKVSSRVRNGILLFMLILQLLHRLLRLQCLSTCYGQQTILLQTVSIAKIIWKHRVTGYFDKQDAADAEDMEHYVYYNGYVSGRMLVNFNDSVALYTGLNKLDEASRYKYNNRTRLGFVEGVHMVITADELLTADKKAFKDGAEKYFPKAVSHS